jgi:hypothetical protein
MHRKREYIGIASEDRCGAVAMMDVEVADEEAARVAFSREPADGDGDVIQRAVALT